MTALTMFMASLGASLMLGQPTSDVPNHRLVFRQLATPSIMAENPMLLRFPTQEKIGGVLNLPLGCSIEDCLVEDWPSPDVRVMGDHVLVSFRFGTSISLEEPNDTNVDVMARFVDDRLVMVEMVFPLDETVTDDGYIMAQELVAKLASGYSNGLIKEASWNEQTREGYLVLEDDDGSQLALSWSGSDRSLVLVVKAGTIDGNVIPANLYLDG